MKNQIHLSSRSYARHGNTRSIIHHRGGVWPGLRLAVCCALLTTAPHPARAAVTEAWVHRYSNVVSNSNDQAVKIVRDAAGDVIVTGSTDDGIHGQDMLTIKYSGANGSVLWQKRYNGPANSDDIATALAVDGSGNVVVTGYSYGTNGTDYYTAKYAAADGALFWEKRYNGPANSDDVATAVAVDGSGNVVVTGSSNDGSDYYTGQDYYTAKYAAADGALLWEKRYNGPANSYDYAQAMVVDGSGNVVVTGNSFNGTNNDYYTVKYAAADGALLWEKRYNGPASRDEYAQAVAVDGGGNVVVTGNSFNGTNEDYCTVKYAVADGALLWEKRYNGPANNTDRAQAVAVDGSGNAVVTGFSDDSFHNPAFYTAKYATADGALLWEKRYNNLANGSDYAYAVAVDASGNVVVTGSAVYENGFGGYFATFYTAKYAAADGALVWEKRYTGSGGPGDRARAVAVDGNGHVVVTGSSFNGTNDDYYTVKYAATDGALLWENRYRNIGPANGSDYAQAVAVDRSGNVVVTGVSKNSASYYDNYNDYYTAKYAAADGALLWEKRYNGPANGDDQAQAVAVDGNGNVVVTGSSFNGTNGYSDYYTAKYAVADGALLWEQRYNDPANSDDFARALAVDGNGNVVVTGNSQNTDYYTAKYAAANGALLWERRYNAMDGRVRAVAVDSGGNVVVTGGAGYDNGFGRYLDYYTAKYAAADGALLWEQRYGATDGSDGAKAVAIDGGGNVVVIGLTNNGSGYYAGADYYTAKYAAANGALVWEKTYNGPANGEDRALAVAVDGSGNVIATGVSSGTNGLFDYYTVKYAAADGLLLWDRRYGGPLVWGDGWGQAVAVDGSGNVVVTGTSLPAYGDRDYYTAKYAAADGALLWEKRYNGPANGDDYASGVALGPSGMVAVTGSSDGNFGSGTTYDYATVVYKENLPPVSVARVTTGIQLRFTGVPGRSYNIERAPAVTGPWGTLATPTAPPGGLIEYVDTNAPVAAAFYRTSTP